MRPLKLVLSLQKHNIMMMVVFSLIAAFMVLKFRSSSYQILTLTILVLIYLAWALTHHYLDKSLSREVVLEYILTALLILIVLYGFLI